MYKFWETDAEFLGSAEGKCEETSATSDQDRRRRIDKPLKARSQGLSYSPSASLRPLNSPAIISSSQSESRSYGSRSKAGDVVFRYNSTDSSAWEKKGAAGVVKWHVDMNPFKRPLLAPNTKYMFQRTREMAIVLNDVVTDLGSTITDYYGLGLPASLKDSTTEEEVYVGRIRSDGKLSGGSVFFEGTMESSSGHFLSLDLSQLEEYFVFPGQVLGLSGMNNLGRCLQVSRLFIPRPLPFRDGTVHVNKTTGPLSVLIAAGPFTPSDSLAFEPLQDLVGVIEKTKADVCFLIGPFLPASHPLLSNGETILVETFEEMFEKQLEEMVGTLAGSVSGNATQIILLSSWNEAHHHPVFPTLPYLTKKFPQVLSIPDPCTISIGGLIFGATSTDILMHLSRNELANAPISSDRMGRMARHLLSQRNFYPLYPPDMSVPLDVELWADHAQMGTTPHVLILPSDLRHFIKDVDGTVVVNPEHLTKGPSGGTYARLLIDLPNEGEETGLGDGSPVADFLSGEILKI